MNLLVNSVEAAHDAANISIQSSLRRAGRIEVLVSDNGPGIDQRLAGRVFEPFFTTKARGAGLGLTTAREAMLALGGDLTLEQAATGATFVVTLKAARSVIVEERPFGSDCR